MCFNAFFCLMCSSCVVHTSFSLFVCTLNSETRRKLVQKCFNRFIDLCKQFHLFFSVFLHFSLSSTIRIEPQQLLLTNDYITLSSAS